MNWANFQTHDEGPTKSFEVMCNQLFKNWVTKEYNENITSFDFVNGAGGDGGVESYAVLKDQSIIGLQAKWFPDSIDSSKIAQIRGSILTAKKIRPEITRYIICIPRDLASKTNKGKDSEDLRWKKLQEEITVEFPDLHLDLWTETRILEELQKETSSGIYKYWFEKSEICEENIRLSFNKSKHSWLQTKYIPELNTFGAIHSCVGNYIGTQEPKDKLLSVISPIVYLAETALQILNELCLARYAFGADFIEVLHETELKLRNIRTEYVHILDWIKNEDRPKFEFNRTTLLFYFQSEINQIREYNEYNVYYFQVAPLVNILKKLDKIKVQDLLTQLNFALEHRPLVFLGEPGTGKTHGIAAVVEELLNESGHIPILIQARAIPKECCWKEVIHYAIGLSSSWSECETWQGLISLANRVQRKFLNHGDQVLLFPKVLVVVDGIDEASDYRTWINRVQESQAIMDAYPQIKFCFLSRPFVFRDKNLNVKTVRLAASGDVSSIRLFDSYIQYYNIDISNHGWVKNALNTPLALKLFCEINKNKTITYESPADISIAALLKEKMKLLEKEYCDNSSESDIKDQCIFKAICILAEVFNHHSSCERNYILKHLSEKLSIGGSRTRTLINFLENYGLLHMYCTEGEGLLASVTYYYAPGIQGYFDYVGALLLLDKYELPKNIDFSESSAISRNALYMLSIISIQTYSYLLTTNETLTNVIDDGFKTELYYFSLRQTTYEMAKQYKSQILQSMSKNAELLHEITNYVILPLARNVNHPLGVSLLHKFLNSFTNPAKRDLLWSVPSDMSIGESEIWYSSVEVNLKNAEYQLCETDTFGGLPTVYAWALSSLDNLRRQFSRVSLMEWALHVPYEFYKLFQVFAAVNDPQIRNDIFSILMNLLFESGDLQLLDYVAHWVMENVLSGEHINLNRDVAIRYYATSIVRRALEFHLLSAEETKGYLPPYSDTSLDIDLSQEALAGTRMGGYSGITYDLSRYVLIDHISSCYDKYSELGRHQIEALISEISKIKPEFSGISLEQLILSAAYQYILRCGWSEDEYRCYPKEGQTRIGVDRAIRHSHIAATHGAQSQVMTICEKYIWQARKFINGYFVDHIMVKDDSSGTIDYISDYGMLDKYLMPILESERKENKDNYSWHIPDLSTEIPYDPVFNEDELKEAIGSVPDIEWQKWVHIDNSNHSYPINDEELIVLHGYSSFDSPSDIETDLYISTILVPLDKVTSFVDAISTIPERNITMTNPYDWDGGVYCDCYISPKEICWMPWKKRYNTNLAEYFPEIEIHSAIDSCTYNYEDSGDACFDLPSLVIRELLGICNTNSLEFYNKDNDVLALTTNVGEEWKNHQRELLVGKSLLNIAEQHGYALVWFMREDRRENSRAREKYEGFYAEKDKTCIGFYENGAFVIKPIVVIPDRNDEISQDYLF